MQSIIKSILAAICLALLSACSSTPNIVYDKANRPPLKSVSLLRIPESQQFTIRDISGTSALGGAIGGAIQGSSDADRSKKFLQAVNDRHVSFSDNMVFELMRQFKARGLELQYLPEQFPKLAADQKSDDYSSISTDTETFLVVWFGPIGFLNTSALKAEYEPWLVIHVKLIDLKTKNVLYQKTFSAGYKANTSNIEFIPLDKKYKFGDFTDLLNRMNIGIESINTGERIIAQRIAADLK